jgi:hypothetical protein
MIDLLNFKKVNRVYHEVKNFFFILSTIDKNKNEEKWRSHNLRSDWIGRIYTVVSLSEEDTGEEIEVQRFKVLEKVRYVNEYLESLQLSEIIVPNISQVQNSRSYLVIYSPYFSQLSYLWMGINLFFPIGLIYEFFIK